MRNPVAQSSESFDVSVIGAGPAGATVANLTAAAGLRTLLVERSPEPQLKVGESLMPATYWTLERLGVLDRMRESAFPKKFSVQFFGSNGQGSAPFYFRDADPHESSQTWQVRREEFDSLLCAAAAECGADVRWGRAVREVRFEGERAVGLLVDGPEGPVSVSSQVVVDASGQSALLAGRLGLRTPDPCLRNAAYWCHVRGARLDDGDDAGATLIFHTAEKRSWFWLIPLPDGLVSVGVVGSVEYLVRKDEGGPARVFDDELALCPALAERLVAAERVGPMRVSRDFSYRVDRVAGDGWVAVGDAAGFIDPIYSSGVFLALKSGEMAADAIVEALEAGDPSGERLGAWVGEYGQGMEAVRRLVYAFYDPKFSFARFVDAYPELRSDIIHVLTGNVYGRSNEPLARALDAYQGVEAAPAGGVV